MQKIKKYTFTLFLFLVSFLVACSGDLNPRSLTSDETRPDLPLIGLDANKPVSMTAEVQAAYNLDTIFFRVRWLGDVNDTDKILHYTNGQWQLEGGHRRDTQSTLDRDVSRGRVDVKSTNAQSSLSFVLNAPGTSNEVQGFSQFGCFIACHEDNAYMPQWDGKSEATMYVEGDDSNRLDLMFVGAATNAPIEWADNQYIGIKKSEGSNNLGGRFGDFGDESFASNVGASNQPLYLLDGSKLNEQYTFRRQDRSSSIYRFFMRPNTTTPESRIPMASAFDNMMSSMGYFQAQERSFIPEEGDMVPAIRLRNPSDRRLNYSAAETVFDTTNGINQVRVQRLLNTGLSSEPNLLEGGIYEIAFAIHTGDTAARDHYISFPFTLGVGNVGADIIAGKIEGAAGGLANSPDFSNLSFYPVTTINLVLPGITSYEFLTGQNVNKQVFPKDSNVVIDQVHGGSAALRDFGYKCKDCHTISDELFTGIGSNVGSLATYVKNRGGVNTPTPIAQ